MQRERMPRPAMAGSWEASTWLHVILIFRKTPNFHLMGVRIMVLFIGDAADFCSCFVELAVCLSDATPAFRVRDDTWQRE